MAKTIRQTVTFAATPKEIYEALMDSRKHAEFTGDAAEISRTVGGAFMASSGYITGTNLELVPGERIVQSWHASDWEPGVMSTATFALAPVGDKTKLTFTHAGVPDEAYESIRDGWHEYYWRPLKAWLAARKTA